MKANKSRSYLIPLLDTEVKIEYPHLLLNSYISDYTISLLYQYDSSTTLTSSGRVGFPTYESYLINHENFVEKVEVNFDNLACVLYTFLFPVDFYSEYDNFCMGKFSSFSEVAKKKIISFLLKNNSREGQSILRIKQVLYKDEKLRKQLSDEFNYNIPNNIELSSIPDLDKEKYEQRTSV